MGIGDVLFEHHKYEEAIVNYDWAIQAAKTKPFSYIPGNYNILLLFQKADAFLNLGRLQAAYNIYSAAIQLSPNSFYLYIGLGDALRLMGREEEAIAAYQDALRYDSPGDSLERRSQQFIASSLSRLYCGMGECYLSLHQYRDAIEAYLEAVKAVPDDPVPSYGIAQAKTAEKHYEEAIPFYLIAIKLNPKFGFAYSGLADVYQILGMRKEARQARQLARQFGG